MDDIVNMDKPMGLNCKCQKHLGLLGFVLVDKGLNCYFSMGVVVIEFKQIGLYCYIVIMNNDW